MSTIPAYAIKDAKRSDRRYRNILANSGQIMESGEVRQLEALYVMGQDGTLKAIRDLETDPDKQTFRYLVKAQADHGERLPDGQPIDSIEKQFGSCKVWLEADGLHARMYFADDDELADHAYAISQDAAYSVGIDWYPEGYYGAGLEIDQPIGILREISMVLTGNDPRAKTIDHKTGKSEAHGSKDEAGNGTKLNQGENHMAGKEAKKDELTPDENTAMKERLVSAITAAVDDFTTNVPESETQPTADEANKAEGETEKVEDKPAETSKDTLHNTVVVVRDKVAKQERTTDAVKAYLKTDKAVAAWGQALLDSKGDAHAWRANFRAIAKKDGVNLGDDVVIAPEAVINAVAEQMRAEDTIFAHVNKTGLAYEVIAIPTSEDGARGHKRGTTKIEESVTMTKRVLTPADLYKLMKLDHSMVKLNGGLGSSAIVRYVLRELPRKLVETIDKAILVGGVKNDEASDPTDFTALAPIVGDINALTPVVYATTYSPEAGDNMRQSISKAANRVTSSSDRTLICTPDYFADLENATTTGGQLLFPNGISKTDPRINGIVRIITPIWLTSEMLDGLDAVIVALDDYHTVGDSTPEEFTDYDIDTNKYVWEQVACIGGGLAAKAAAVGISASVSA